MGGDAELELLDSLDPFSEGVVFSVRPPKKSWKHMSKLSGNTIRSFIVSDKFSYSRRRENFEFFGVGVCAPLLQTNSSLLHGRNRRSVGLQKRVNCRQLYQRKDEERSIHHHQFEKQYV